MSFVRFVSCEFSTNELVPEAVDGEDVLGCLRIALDLLFISLDPLIVPVRGRTSPDLSAYLDGGWGTIQPLEWRALPWSRAPVAPGVP